MEEFIRNLETSVDAINGVLWADWVLYILLGTGILFTIWSGFCQYRALTHGSRVIRGDYDRKSDPGAINHFQALSSALSATVGLGNIAGVSVAVALGGPGAVFWMWVVGFVGMALKTTEVTLSMLYRNADPNDEPHGGPMWVAKKGFERWSPKLKPVGAVVGTLFCITLLISAITGGNMFQAWNVAEVTTQYFPTVPRIVSGILMAALVGAVIIGGIKRIGAVAGRLVPFMCVIYLLAGFYVLAIHLGDIPDIFRLIIASAFSPVDAGQSFLGATTGYAFLWGMKRALFSNEAGQGSSPIIHSAAKTDEPVREGIVAGLEPFIDTIVVCTITALVVLASGAWNRPPETMLPNGSTLVVQNPTIAQMGQLPTLTGEGGDQKLVVTDPVAVDTTRLGADRAVFVLVDAPDSQHANRSVPTAITGSVSGSGANSTIVWGPVPAGAQITDKTRVVYQGATPKWTVSATTIPPKVDTEQAISGIWEVNNGVFVVVGGGFDERTGRDRHKITGTVQKVTDAGATVQWDSIEAAVSPQLVGMGVFGNYAGASLTSHAFDRVTPGLGMWIVVLASWLFALSTMISWSYYGEQGVVYITGGHGVFLYKIIYCLMILVATVGVIKTDAQLDAWSALGTGVMLFANIPIMLVFGYQAMRAYHEYIRKLKSGVFHPHRPPKLSDVVEGKDTE